MMNQFSKSMRIFIDQILENSCDIWRSLDVQQPNGSIRRDFVQVSTNTPCRLSRQTSRRVVLANALPQITAQSDARLYLKAEADVIGGDRIQYDGMEIFFDVSEVFLYPSHTECTLKQVVEL